MLAIVLALGTSVAYGVGNFLAPVLMRRHAFAAVLLTGQVAALVGSFVLLGISGEAAPDAGAVGLAVLAGVGNAAGLAGFYEAVRYGPLSVATPIGATAAVLPVLVGVIGGDTLRKTQRGRSQLAASVVAVTRRAASAAPPMASTMPATWAAEDGELFWALSVQRSTIVLIFVALILLRGQSFRRPAEMAAPTRAQTLALLAPGLLLLAGTLMYILAAERGQLSVVAVCGSLFPLVTVGLAIAVLGERVGRAQVVGVAAAVAGVCLIAL